MCVLFLYVNKIQNESSLRAPLGSHCYSWHSLVLLLTTKLPHWHFPRALWSPLKMLGAVLKIDSMCCGPGKKEVVTCEFASPIHLTHSPISTFLLAPFADAI